MSVNFNSSVSALQANSNLLALQANNIANVNTDGYKKLRGLTQEQTPDGVSLTVDQVDTPGAIRLDQTAEGTEQVETSNVDLNEEMPQMLVDQRSFEANLATIRTQDEMLGTLMDLKA